MSDEYREILLTEDRVERTHWWYINRRLLFRREISALALPATARMLDIGSSCGANLAMLREMGFAHAEGMDTMQESVDFCLERGLSPMHLGDVQSLPFAKEQFDMVMATDILEHVDDDHRAMAEIHRVLTPGGMGLITTPAFEFLRGDYERLIGHKRRYRLQELRARAEAVGLVVKRSYYFNYLLLPVIFLMRQAIKRLGLQMGYEHQIPRPWVNAILKVVFRLDVESAPYLHPPLGVSALMVVEKPLVMASNSTQKIH